MLSRRMRPRMELIASKLKTTRESLNISLEQVSKDTRIGLRQLESLECGRYSDLPGGMYNRAIIGAYCDELGLDRNEILRRYDDEVAPALKNTSTNPLSTRFHPRIYTSFYLHFQKNKHAFAALCLVVVFGSGLFLIRGRLTSVLSPYFSPDNGGMANRLPSIDPPATEKFVNSGAAEGEGGIRDPESPAIPSAGGSADASPPYGRTAQATDSVNLQALRIEIVSRAKCWLSITSDGAGAVIKTLSPGDVEFFTASRTVSLIVGNAGGVSLRINDRAAKTLGQAGQVVRLTINEDTLPSLLDPSVS